MNYERARGLMQVLLNHYGLREQPFAMTSDPKFLYLGSGHRESLASLVYSIAAGRGFVALVAETGMGKTTLLFNLLRQLQGYAETAFLFQTQFNPREFMQYLLIELGHKMANQDLVLAYEDFNKNLVRNARAGKKTVIVIDEAQNLDIPVLETVRLLSNFETPKNKLLHIVMAGQPRLADKLSDPSLVQLRQRISVIAHLSPLSPEETCSYIAHRLRVAGYEGVPLFAPGALAMIAAHSKGIPRNINNLCFAALSIAYALGKRTVDANIVEEAAADFDLSRVVSQQCADSYPSAEAVEFAGTYLRAFKAAMGGAAQSRGPGSKNRVPNEITMGDWATV